MKYIKLLGVAFGTIFAAEFIEGTDWAKNANTAALAKDPTMTGNSLEVKAAKYGGGAIALVVAHRILMGKGK